MKKCALVFVFLMLSSSVVFARFHERYELYRSCDCYGSYCRPHRIKPHGRYRIYYPQTGISVNIGNNYHSMGPVARSIYYSQRRHRGAVSVRVSI